MSDSAPSAFHKLLDNSRIRGGFETDDLVAALLPLLRRVQSAHEGGLVAPLRGLSALLVDEEGVLQIAEDELRPPSDSTAALDKIQATDLRAFDVVGRDRRTTDFEVGIHQTQSLNVVVPGSDIVRPVYVTGYETWEHVVGHHDALTDIFSLGLLLASLATGLDFAIPEDLERFVSARGNLFALESRLHPVVARLIVEMTELNRHRRAQDVRELSRRLEHYREVVAPEELDFAKDSGFAKAGVPGRRRIIQERLRDRLFEISRRNRLIYFRPNLHTLNLTIASVPIVMDPKSIRAEQLCYWHSRFATDVVNGEPINLGRYLRMEDAPYIPGVLDKIIGEVRRDRAEFGFAQLRLALCFLRWHNLKEEPKERIYSPLLLLPVEITKKKGVRDSYLMEPVQAEAEVNPVLRHHLHELYGLELPATVNLRETTMDDFHAELAARIQASEPGVVLRKVDRPQIRLVHERARQRMDQWRRKQRAQPLRPRHIDYSYSADDFRPLGLRLFLEKVRPTPAPLRAAGETPLQMPQFAATNVAQDGVTERQVFELHEGGEANPYAWDFDLCALTLGNFNYRKMTLVQDYSGLIGGDLASAAFDSVFGLAAREPERNLPALPLEEQYLVVPSDATQVSALTRARTGASYIIQGPPGTGKSQTITNLIADFVAHGKRVLFVCEKRAAIDVVFHRLRQQGLDELCCLIHDSQTDKKAFVQSLKQTYEDWIARADEPVSEEQRTRALRVAVDEIAALERFSAGMKATPENFGLPVRDLMHRLVELNGAAAAVSPEELERLPHYTAWLACRETVRMATDALRELGRPPILARHPLRLLGREVLDAERPMETLRRHVETASGLLREIQGALAGSGLPIELWDTFAETRELLDFAAQAAPLAENNLLGLLDSQTEVSRDFAKTAKSLADETANLARLRERTGHWREKLAPADAEAALAQSKQYDASFLRFLSPGYYGLKKIVRSRYAFSRHAIAPSLTKVLEDLVAEHAAAAALARVEDDARRQYAITDFAGLLARSSELRAQLTGRSASVAALARRFTGDPAGVELARRLAQIQGRLQSLHECLGALLVQHERFDFSELLQILEQLQAEAGGLPEMLPALTEIAVLPEAFAESLREVDLPPAEFEAASARRSLAALYHEDRALARTDGRALDRRRGRVDERQAELYGQNAETIRARARKRFLERVALCSAPAGQLDVEQKELKRVYSAGRREVEHEFAKTMRYKSIRDLAAGNSGRVVRDLKPIWLMSPLSVSDTLPLEPELFDVVIFDEASQIPVEEAIPAVYRAPQAIVVGDEMQLPPTNFFSASAPGEDESVVVEHEGERISVAMDADSFLTQSARNLPSTLLAWHYRSRYEALISFSNAAFYGGGLFTIPDRQLPSAALPELTVREAEDGAKNAEALLARSLSFHFMERSPYADRRNAGEAAYIAQMVREILRKETKLSVGIVAFSEAQQGEIEAALDRLGEEDSDFAARLAEELIREEHDQFCGLFVKNLENVQGDERDIIILSICYGPDAAGRMLMNFGPINQRGGEKRLNVIFSRAKRHMAVVSSIRHSAVTNVYNDGAAALKAYLHFAECVSCGDLRNARRVIEGVNSQSREALAAEPAPDAVKTQLAEALRELGHTVDLDAGQSRFRCDLAVRGADGFYALGILVDTARHYENPDVLERYCTQPAILRGFGWRILFVLAKDWLEQREGVLERIGRVLRGQEDESV